MKRLLLFAAIAVASVGCSSPETGVRLLNSHSFKLDCTIDQTVSIGGGSLDLAGTDRYFVAVDVDSDLTAHETSIGGQVVQPSHQNDFYIEKVHYSYTSDPPLAFAEETSNLHYVVAAEAEGGYMTVDLIQPQALQTILSTVAKGDSLNILVTFYAEGKTAGGKSGKTNKISYPIEVFYSSFAGCAATDQVAPGGPCGNVGQDSKLGCCSNPAFASDCAGT